MLLPRKLFSLGLLAVTSVLAEVHVTEQDWAIEADFPAQPKADDFRKATEQGDQLTRRYYLELSGKRYMAARFIYPVAPSEESYVELYKSSVEELMKSRPGELKLSVPFTIGDYTGLRLLINQQRDRTVREIRLIAIGASLYVLSAEWPAAGATGSPPEMERFLQGAVLRPEYRDSRLVNDRDRWRELGAGRFRLRYDATRWYRDPADNEAGVYNFLRVDKKAEAQFIAEMEPLKSATMEESVLATARESAESVNVRQRGRKLRSGVNLEELEFSVRTEGVTYINHGYFYTGTAGSMQLRAWAPDKAYASVSGDIAEFLDGLSISAAPVALK